LNFELEAKGLSLFRGDHCLFDGIDFALGDGQMLLLRGPNGSGKTSLLRGLCGLIEFEDGELIWQGQSIRDDRQAFRAVFEWYGHKAGFKADLTAEENLDFEASLGPRKALSPRDALERLGLDRQRGLPVRSLSAGQQRRASLARLLLADAPLWIMDEPYTNLDADGRALVDRLLVEHLDRGGMAIVATHHDIDGGERVSELELGR
jgi:heme exporter protein A